MELIDFLIESNRIEGIYAAPSAEQLAACESFLELSSITVSDLCALVAVIEPRAELRDRVGLNVRVGSHYPPPGGPEIIERLEQILPNLWSWSPYDFHVAYETLHPFTDGNGRSGRMLWLWNMWQALGEVPPLGFLHTWYYQSLGGAREDGRD